MFRRKRILLLSSSVVMLCLALIVGATFALFTEEATVTNHLRAGHLKATLVRHSYEYVTLDDDGVMTRYKGTQKDMDFSEANAKNFFGFDKNIILVPGSSFESVFTLGNEGTTAYAYNFEIVVDKVNDATNDYTYSSTFASQLYATIGVIDDNGNRTEIVKGYLDKPLTYTSAATQLFNTDCVIVDGNSSEKFYVRVDFVSVDGNNNAEQDQVWFDFVVNATQYTEVQDAK